MSIKNCDSYIRSIGSFEIPRSGKKNKVASNESVKNDNKYEIKKIPESSKTNTTDHISSNMPNDVRSAFNKVVNTLDDKDRLMIIALTLDVSYVRTNTGDTTKTPTLLDYNYFKEQCELLINPPEDMFVSEDAKNTYRNFLDLFKEAYSSEQQKEEPKNDIVSKFLYDLRTKGAVQFLADLNEEKIDLLVEQYKKKLLENSTGSKESIEDINKLVEDFKKQLLENMKDKMESKLSSSSNRNAIPISKDPLIQTIIVLQQKMTNSPLNELLGTT